MTNEGPKNDYPEGENGPETPGIDETPPATAATVEERPSHPPVTPRPSSRPVSLGRVLATTALGAGIVLSSVEERRNGPPTPRVPQVTMDKDRRRYNIPGSPGENGGAAGSGDSDVPDGGLDASAGTGSAPPLEEDRCGPQSFAQDVTPDEMAKAGETSPCQFIVNEDGSTRVIGHTLIDADGIPRDCFVTEPFAKNAATKIRGEYHGAPAQPGKIYLDKGKLCVTVLSEGQSQEGVETVIPNEASLHIFTTQRVMVKLLEPERLPESEELMQYALVSPEEGETLIVQEGRDQPIHLKKGDTPVKIPLNKVAAENTGCYIASARPQDVEQKRGAIYMLGATAIFMVLRRRRKPKSDKARY